MNSAALPTRWFFAMRLALEATVDVAETVEYYCRKDKASASHRKKFQCWRVVCNFETNESSASSANGSAGGENAGAVSISAGQ